MEFKQGDISMAKFFKKSTLILKVIWLLFILSLLLNPFTFVDGEKLIGIGLLYSGWMGILLHNEVQGWYCWYANITFIILSVGYQKRSISNLIFAILTLSLVAKTFFITGIWVNEGGPSQILTRDLGYYLWVVALVLLSFYTIIKYFFKKTQL
ncbi:MAG: hypothetical protein K0R18_1930 [Bacillales bacterium]|jgi:hypothetical protein|nr:hypothetical protein [Bacillales bacterium]